MRKIYFPITPCFSPIMHAVFIAAVIFFSTGTCFAQDDLISQKKKLTSRLDSIQLEKQKRKRDGADINKLEKESARLRDSIDALKKRLFSLDPSVYEQRAEELGKAEGPENILKSLMPRDLFDWIIIIIGGVAILCAVILIAGLFKNSGSRKKRAKEKKGQFQKAVPSPPPPEHPKPAPQRSQGFPPPPEQVPKQKVRPHTDTDDARINALRQRINSEISQIKKFDNQIPPGIETRQINDPEPAPKKVPNLKKAQPQPSESHPDSGNLKSLVVTDAAKGLGVQEISRKHHISIDQVSLILRMAKKDYGSS
ncbi:MAG: hypothetical protein GF401_09720 [Chitinivibrionales bacterium]|nr:hypothetical protein [Chitinivibrionales bacterium]